MISKDSIICPYCKKEHTKSLVLGTSGVINIFGTERELECTKCGKSFRCEVEVKITYKTKKV